jgi:hypothetical protein
MKERRKSKEKVRKQGYGEREMSILRCHEFFGVLLAA